MPLYSNWLLGVLNGTFSTDWDTDTIRVSLFAQSASATVINSTGQVYWADISAQEIAAGSGYSASGMVATGMTIAFNGHNPTRIKLDATDTAWTTSTITAKYAVLWKQTSNPNTSPLIAWVDFGSNYASTNGTFTIVWSASGIGEITIPNS